MDSEYVSDEIKHLTTILLKSCLKERVGKMKIPTKFVDIYDDACIKRRGINNENESYIEIRQHVRHRLVRDGYIFVDPEDVNYIFFNSKVNR